MSSALELPTNLAYAQGAYTVAVEFGSEQRVANLALDTGSSTLVVLPHVYDPEEDAHLRPTSLAQQVGYGQGSWAGPVLHSQVSLGDRRRKHTLDAAQFALVIAARQNFRDYDGLFGLAYRGLNKAHDVTELLTSRGLAPPVTWPWPFADDDDNLSEFKTLLKQEPTVTLTPLFTALEERGCVANKFGMLIRRSLVHVLDDTSTTDQRAKDPLNRGMLVLGGGEECRDLYEGAFRDIRIVHDLYYNANLIAVQVGDRPRIPAPPLAQSDVKRAASNAIFDTGCSFVILESSIYEAMMADFAHYDERFPALIERFREAFKQELGIPNETVDHEAWPVVRFYLESANGNEVSLTLNPGQYWPRNALRAGQSYFMLMSQLPNWPDQSILGLPLMCGRYCVFDRSKHEYGVLRIATAQDY